MNENGLKPCPFCGGEAVYHNYVQQTTLQINYPACYIKCTNCGTETRSFAAKNNTFDYKDLATEAWNRRAE